METAIVAAPTQPSSLLAVVERAATNPDVDVVKLRELLQMAREERSYNAEVEFNEAMNRAQAAIGRVAPDATNKQTGSEYAKYAALDRAVRPIYTGEGISLSFDTGEAPADYVLVLCHASKGGYTRTYRALVPADGKGPKGNDVQTKTHAFGSGMTYGKRQLLKAIFNIAEGVDPESDAEDDDGNGASDTRTPGERDLADRAAAALDTWLDHVRGADTLESLATAKEEIRKAYGAGNIPAPLLTAYSARLHALTPAKPK